MTELVLVALFVVGLIMVLSETLMPGIIMGIIGALCIIASVGLAYFHPDIKNPTLAFTELAIALVLVPAAFYFAIKRLKLSQVLDEASGVDAFSEDHSSMLDKTGEALTDLRPSGTVMIDNRKFDVLTTGESISKGTSVRVTEVSGNRIVVRAL